MLKLIAAAALAACLAPVDATAQEPDKPNILVIWGMTSGCGTSRHTTEA